LAVTCGLLGACGNSFTPDIRYRMIGLSPAVAGVCADATEPAPPEIATAVAVRMTYTDAGTRTLRCDAVLPIGAEGPVLAVPGAQQPVDLVVEYVDAAGLVVGRGAANDVDLAGGGEITVRIAPSAAFACAPDRAASGRAFHSATLLPSGEVLLLGGIAGPAGVDDVDPTAGFFLQPRAEIYDPVTGVVRPANIPDLVPRAFHQAYVLPLASGDIGIMVLGGLSVTGDPATTPVIVAGTDYHLEAAPNAVGAAGQLLTYDPVASAFSASTLDAGADLTARGFGGFSAPTDAARAYVGGQNLGVAGEPALGNADAIVLDETPSARGATQGTRRSRIGATVTEIAPNTVLVWGGDVTAGDVALNPELGELLTGWPETPGTAQVTLDGASPDNGPFRAFGAAALAGDGSVIVGGGYRMDLDTALVPVGAVLQRLENPGGAISASTLLNGSAASPGGYTAAVTLVDGDVLVAGGAPDPTDCTLNPCALPQALRYDRTAATGAVTGAMGVARYGLALTVLRDGTVLASGGITNGNPLAASPDLEIYEPRGTADDPLAPDIVRDPGDVARDTDGNPVASCAVINADAGN
jgi:hypothetical protein